MPNINAFRSVIHEKKMLKDFCSITYLVRACPFDTSGILFEQTGILFLSKVYPCQIAMHLGQWSMRRCV